jgi:hypothetical protein
LDSLEDSLAEDFDSSDAWLDDEPEPLVAGAVCVNLPRRRLRRCLLDMALLLASGSGRHGGRPPTLMGHGRPRARYEAAVGARVVGAILAVALAPMAELVDAPG